MEDPTELIGRRLDMQLSIVRGRGFDPSVTKGAWLGMQRTHAKQAKGGRGGGILCCMLSSTR